MPPDLQVVSERLSPPRTSSPQDRAPGATLRQQKNGKKRAATALSGHNNQDELSSARLHGAMPCLDKLGPCCRICIATPRQLFRMPSYWHVGETNGIKLLLPS